MTTQELTEDSDFLVVYHLHGQTDRSMIWANGTQNSELVNFDSESLLPLFCTNQCHLPENDHEGLKLITKKALKKGNTNFRYLEYSVRKNRGAFHSTKTLENLETAANGTEIFQKRFQKFRKLLNFRKAKRSNEISRNSGREQSWIKTVKLSGKNLKIWAYIARLSCKQPLVPLSKPLSVLLWACSNLPSPWSEWCMQGRPHPSRKRPLFFALFFGSQQCFFFSAFFHLLRILVPGYWQGKSYFKKTMKLKDIKRRTTIEIISHNTSVLFSMLFNWSFIAIKMNLFLSFLQQQEEIFYFFLFVAI